MPSQSWKALITVNGCRGCWRERYYERKLGKRKHAGPAHGTIVCLSLVTFTQAVAPQPQASQSWSMASPWPEGQQVLGSLSLRCHYGTSELWWETECSCTCSFTTYPQKSPEKLMSKNDFGSGYREDITASTQILLKIFYFFIFFVQVKMLSKALWLPKDLRDVQWMQWEQFSFPCWPAVTESFPGTSVFLNLDLFLDSLGLGALETNMWGETTTYGKGQSKFNKIFHHGLTHLLLHPSAWSSNCP